MHKELLIKLLGLEPSASDEAISNAANTFQADMVEFKSNTETENERLANAAQTAEERAVAAEARAETLSNANKAMTEELANVDLVTYKDVISNAEEVKAALLSNRAGTVAVLKNIKVAPVAPVVPKTEPLHNSKTAGRPAPVVQGEQPEITKDQAIRISNRARELVKTLNMSHQSAFIAAKGEVAREATTATK